MKRLIISLAAASLLSISLLACSSGSSDGVSSDSEKQNDENVYEFAEEKTIIDNDDIVITMTSIEKGSENDGTVCYMVNGDMENKTDDKRLTVNLDNVVANGYTIGNGIGQEIMPGTKAKAVFYITTDVESVPMAKDMDGLSGNVYIVRYDANAEDGAMPEDSYKEPFTTE